MLFIEPLPLARKSRMKLPLSVRSVGYFTVFLKNGSLDFSEVLRELRWSWGWKTDEVEFFRKILTLGKKLKNSSKIKFFWLLPKL